MGWSVLVLGLALWMVAHLLGRLAPQFRARLGDRENPKDKSKGLFALAIVLSVVLMVIGYRTTPYVHVYVLPGWALHLNNLLVLIGFYLFAVSGAKTRLAQKIRHPQLTGFSCWAIAHLLVNGDLASLLLFGGLLIWAFVEIRVINSQTEWIKPPIGPMRKEFTSVIATLVLFGLVAAVHTWLGYYPFPR